MLIIIIIGNLVFQFGDTLKFYKNDSLIDQWIMEAREEAQKGIYYLQKAKVSTDNKKFLLYEEKFFSEKDSIFTKLTLYDADKKKVWSKIKGGQRKISFELTNLYPDKIIIFTLDRTNSFPVMEIMKGNRTRKIDLTQWTGIVDYEISPNGRYLLFHTKKPYSSRLWDYIYFLDLQTKAEWEYLFPFCFSCKRGKIFLKIDDEGKSEVIYRNEHRIFDKKGNLVDIFVKVD
uniref:Dipeptidylpeptidase IV N-terminal domain-containing protein n=1 Tax=candidate division WOR-3 bacterium TaxID=2052148 RepID=A0A7C4TGN0_UNCW3